MSGHENLALEHQLCVALNHAARAINGCYRPPLAEIGLTYGQYTVMLVLWERGSTTLGELGEILHLDSGTLSPLVKRMADAELLTRVRSTDDERVLDIDITAHGEGLRSSAAAAQQSVEDRTAMSSSELATLRDQLNRLTAHLRTSDDLV